MNKTVKRILIGAGIVIAMLVLCMIGFFIKMKSEINGMNVIDTREIVHNIYSINNSFVNMFLVKDIDGFVAIDAGNNKDSVFMELKKLNINPEKVVAILLTHTDGDHVASLPLFKNAKIYLSRQEEQMINGTTSKFLFIGNNIHTKEYTLLNDQQVLKIGNLVVKGILTPGHTPGSMSYLINDKYLFVGDAFGLKNDEITNPNEFFSKDMKTAILSFDKIAHFPIAEYIFTAHNGFSNNYKNAIKNDLK